MTMFTIEGEELMKKKVTDKRTTGGLYLPKKWIGREVAIVLLAGK